MSNRAIRIVGFLVAGAVLVGLADVAPDAALGLTAVIGLGVALSHASEIQQLSNAFITATGHSGTSAASSSSSSSATAGGQPSLR